MVAHVLQCTAIYLPFSFVFFRICVLLNMLTAICLYRIIQLMERFLLVSFMDMYAVSNVKPVSSLLPNITSMRRCVRALPTGFWRIYWRSIIYDGTLSTKCFHSFHSWQRITPPPPHLPNGPLTLGKTHLNIGSFYLDNLYDIPGAFLPIYQ